jgi:hypothetical protein
MGATGGSRRIDSGKGERVALLVPSGIGQQERIYQSFAVLLRASGWRDIWRLDRQPKF